MQDLSLRFSYQVSIARLRLSLVTMSSQTPIGQVVFGDFYADDNNNPVDHSLSDVSFFQDNHGPVQFEQFQDNGNLQHPQLFRDNTNVMEHSNGLPVHGLPEYHGFNQLNQIHYPAGPMMMPQQISAQAPPMPPSHMLVAHHQPPPPPRKKPEELDSACRPRLTAEQTLILEDYFSHTPRPTTQQKRQHAINLNLTQEKVNVSNATPYRRHILTTHR